MREYREERCVPSDVRIPRYRMTDTMKLQLLSELAAARGHPDLASDVRSVARFLSRAGASDGDEASRSVDASRVAELAADRVAHRADGASARQGRPRAGWSNNRH